MRKGFVSLFLGVAALGVVASGCSHKATERAEAAATRAEDAARRSEAAASRVEDAARRAEAAADEAMRRMDKSYRK